jgi:DNA polymerase IV
VLLDEVEQVSSRLRCCGLAARTITLKLRYGDFTTLTRSATDAEATDLTEVLWARAEQVFAHWSARSAGALRLLGFAASNFRRRGDGSQLELFEDPHQTCQRQLDRTVDAIAERFGPQAMRRGRTKE